MAKAMILSNKWYGHQHHWVTPSSSTIHKFSHGKKMDIKVNASFNSDGKKRANLCAAKKDRIRLPTYSDDLGGKKYHISEFLNHPSGIAAVLNTKALQSFQFLDANTYRCELPKLQFLNFEAAPVLDLRVTSTHEDCLVEMLSCKFEGSEVVEEQNNHFSAFMVNHMTWDGAGAESFLEVDVKLNLTLEPRGKESPGIQLNFSVVKVQFPVCFFSKELMNLHTSIYHDAYFSCRGSWKYNDASFGGQAGATATSADATRL